MRSDVRQLRADGQHYKAVVHTRFVDVVMSLDVDVQGQYVYFADMGNKSIARASLKSSDHFVHLVRNIEKPEGIAYDWISNKVYWTATHPKCKLCQTLLKALISCKLCRTLLKALISFFIFICSWLLYIMLLVYCLRFLLENIGILIKKYIG